MIQFILEDNTINSYIPIEAKKPIFGFLPKEESLQGHSRDWNFDGTNNITGTESAPAYNDAFAALAAHSVTPVNDANTATDYIGAVTVDTPYILQDKYVDFSMIDTYTNDILTIAGTNIESLMTSFYSVNDTNKKAISLFNGLQVLRIPANIFNDTSITPTLKKYGSYYLKISPKYLQTTITGFTGRDQETWANTNTSNPKGRRTVTLVDSNPFISDAIWNFGTVPLGLTVNQQRGRLQESIVEIWDSTLKTLKQTKFVVEDIPSLASGSSTSLVLSPDTVGYDSPNQVASIGDVLRIYPRETYFKTIFIQLIYQDTSTNIMSLVRFMKNDTTRSLISGIYEVYDDAGVTIDQQGNINGNVIMSYQISQVGSTEIRRKTS